MDERTKQLREKSRQQIEQLRKGVRNMHKVYYGDMPRPYQFAWSLLDDPETATRMTTEYSDNYRTTPSNVLNPPSAASYPRAPQHRSKPASSGAPSPTGVMDLESEIQSPGPSERNEASSSGERVPAPRVYAYENEHDAGDGFDHHSAGSAFEDHYSDDGEEQPQTRNVAQPPREHRPDAHGHRGSELFLPAPKPTEEPVLRASEEDAVVERRMPRPHSAPARRGCNPRWSTEYSDKFRWWSNFGERPGYICPDGRPEVPPPRIDLAPQLYRSPWRTEYQDSSNWIDLLRTAPAAVNVPESTTPDQKVSPNTMTVDSIGDAVRRSEPQPQTRGGPRQQAEQVDIAPETARSEPTTTKHKFSRGAPATRQGRGRRAQSFAQTAPASQPRHRTHAPRTQLAATAPAPQSCGTQCNSNESIHSKPRAPARRISASSRPSRYDILTSNIRYPNLSDKQLGRWRTEYSRSFQWPLDK